MYIEGLGTNYGETSSYTNTKKLGREDFLKLLVEQLKHQDPLNPLESTDFTAQLAQFSSLEQLFGMNEALTGIQETLHSQNEENILDLIGKTVKTDDNAIIIKDGNIVSGSYLLEDMADVTISIYDSNGSEIKKINIGAQDAKEYDVPWDGMDESGNLVEDGIYTFEVLAKNDAGKYVSVNTYTTGEVTGVTFEYGIPCLMIGDRLISTEQAIIEITKTVKTS